MIIGIGTDIIEPERLKTAMARQRFSDRVFTEAERARIDDAGSGDFRWQRAAGIFAGKEAAVKALGCGFVGVKPTDVEILADPSGRPTLRFCGGALERANALGVRAAHISISHITTAAQAFVILEG